MPQNLNQLTGPGLMRCIRLSQNIAVRCIRLYIRLTAHQTNVQLRVGDLVAGSTYIIASNHQTRLDPFIIAAELPEAVWRQLRPLRFFAYNDLFRSWPLRLLLLALGCFPAKPHNHYSSGVAAAEAMLQQYQTVVIFPEGKRVASKGQARPGVAALAQQPNVRLLPVHLQWHLTRWGRKSYRMVIGRPLDASKLPADQILSHIYHLQLPPLP